MFSESVPGWLHRGGAAQMFAGHEAEAAAFSRVFSRVLMFCIVRARDCRVVIRIFSEAEVGAGAWERDVVLLIFGGGALEEAALLVICSHEHARRGSRLGSLEKSWDGICDQVESMNSLVESWHNAAEGWGNQPPKYILDKTAIQG